MDEHFIKRIASYSFALLLIVIVISCVITKKNNLVIYADVTQVIENNKDQVKDNKSNPKDSITQLLGDKYLIIKKLDNSMKHVNVEEIYMQRSINITISDMDKQKFSENSIELVVDGNKSKHLPIVKQEDTIMPTVKLMESGQSMDSNDHSDVVNGYYVTFTGSEISHSNVVIHVRLDNIYASIIYQDDENIYIDLRRPKDVYKKIVVIDAGHGGTDSGTYSKSSISYEKDINLSIMLYLKEKFDTQLLDQNNIKVYYTRTLDQTVYLNPRVKLANDLEADYFISIHCNADLSPNPNGAEVLYQKSSNVNGAKSEQLAKLCLEEITNVTQKSHQGLVDGNNIVIIKKAKMPVALVEVAFMSNQEDLRFLLQETNQKKVADAIYNVIQRAYEEMKP